ncbi:MAG: hypothetical protein R3F39_05690 [Myxococcota bacterium]
MSIRGRAWWRFGLVLAALALVLAVPAAIDLLGVDGLVDVLAPKTALWPRIDRVSRVVVACTTGHFSLEAWD